MHTYALAVLTGQVTKKNPNNKYLGDFLSYCHASLLSKCLKIMKTL